MESSRPPANFAGLPEALLTRIFLHGSLELTDKMHCEAVCSAWRDILRCKHVVSRGIWTRQMHMQLGLSTEGQETIRLTDSTYLYTISPVRC